MITIRRYKPSDKKSVISLWQYSFPQIKAKHIERLKFEAHKKTDELLFVAEYSGEIIASCLAIHRGARGQLYSVSLSLQMQHTNIGIKLVKHTIKQLEKLGCQQINLHVDSENEQVNKFYQSLGFTIKQPTKLVSNQ